MAPVCVGTLPGARRKRGFRLDQSSHHTPRQRGHQRIRRRAQCLTWSNSTNTQVWSGFAGRTMQPLCHRPGSTR